MSRIEEFIPNALLPLESPDVCLHPDDISPGDLVRSSFNRNAIGLVLGFTHERKVRVLWQEDPGPQVVINTQINIGTPRKLRAKWERGTRGGETVKRYGIAYTSDGSPAGEVVSWHSTTWNNLQDALEGCENDGWRGYVCEYPSGYRPAGGWGSEEEKS